MILAGSHHGLPDLTLCHFAVAEDGVDAVILAGLLAGQRHADRRGDALTERARGHIDAGNVLHLDVAGHVAVDAAEHVQLLDREEAAQRQHRVQCRGAVALGHDETVTVGVLWVLGIDLHHVKIKIGQHVQTAHRSARMSGCRFIYHLHAQKARLCSLQPELLFLDVVHMNSFLCCWDAADVGLCHI